MKAFHNIKFSSTSVHKYVNIGIHLFLILRKHYTEELFNHI